MTAAPTPLLPGARLQRDPLAAIAVPLAPIVLEGRYRLLVAALWRLRIRVVVMQQPPGHRRSSVRPA